MFEYNNYNLYSSFETDGKWFVGEQQEESLSGKLIFRAGEYIELQLYAGYRQFLFDKIHLNLPDVLVGTTTNGFPCSLLRNHVGDVIVSTNGLSKVIIRSEILVIGWYFNSEMELSFEMMGCKFPPLESWLGHTWLKGQVKEDRSYQITYSFPDPIEIALPERDGQLEIVYRHGHGFGAPNYFEVFHDVFVNFYPREPLHFDSFLRFFRDIQSLLSLMLGRPVHLAEVHAFMYSEIIDEENQVVIGRDKVIKVLFPSHRPASIGRLSTETLIPFLDIKDEFATIIRKWFDLIDTLGPTIDLLISYLGRLDQFPKALFLSMVQALESYHRATRVSKGKRPYLRERLAELYEEIPEYVRSLTDEQINQNIKLIIDTRNYLTHYVADLEDKSLTEKDLVNVSRHLMIMLCTLLLKRLGLSDETIKGAIDRMEDELY